MKNRTYALVVLVSAAVLPACTMAEAKTGAQDINSATHVQCVSDRTTLSEAVANYKLLERKMPRNEAALVPGYLLTQSTLYDLDAQGNVVPAPGSGCT